MPARIRSKPDAKHPTRTEFAVRVKTRGRFTAHGVAAQCATINHEFNFPPARSRARGAHKNRTNARSRAANFSDNQPRSSPHFHPVSLLAPWSRCSLSPPSYPLSLSVFSLSFLSFLPLSPSRHCGTCSTRLHAHIRTHITYLHRALSRKSCSTGAFFFRSLLPVPAPPFLLSSFLALTRSLLPVSSSPLSLPFKRSPFPARSSSRPGPRIFSRARLSRCNDAIARYCLEFPVRFSGIFAAVRPCHIRHV